MADFNIFTAFKARDKVTPAFKKMGAGATNFGAKSNKAFKNASGAGRRFVSFAKAKLHKVLFGTGKKFDKLGKKSTKFGDNASFAFMKASRSGGKFGKVLKRILVGGFLVSGFLLLKQGIGEVTTEFISFDQAITSASAKFKDLNLQTEAGQKTLASLKKTARDVGAVTQFTAGQAAQGLDFLALAGFSAQQSMALLPGVVDLATVANIELGRATDIASDALGAFGLMTKDSAQLTENFTRVNDVMALTMSRTNTGIEDMFEAIKNGAPAFTAAGQSVESFNALIGVLAASGTKGSKAGVDLRNIMLSLAKPTGEAADLLGSLGIKTADASGNFRDVIDILADFEKGLKGMGAVQKAAAIKTIFGKRTITSFGILLKAGTKEIRSFRGELEAAGGKSKEMADIMRQSIGNQLAAMKSSLIEVGFKFFTAFEQQGAGAIKFATEAIRNFDVQPVIDGVKFAFNAFKSLFDAIKPHIPLIKELVVAFLAYNIAMKIFMGLQAASAFFTLAKGIAMTSGAFGLLKAALLANPVMLIVGAVFLLIKGLGILQKKFKIFDKVAEMSGFKFLKSIGGFVADPLGSIFGTEAVPKVPKKVGVAPTQPQAIAPKKTEVAPQEVTAPNKAEVAARQKIDFQGLLRIAGAPPGSTAESKTTGAPQIALELLGVNP